MSHSLRVDKSDGARFLFFLSIFEGKEKGENNLALLNVKGGFVDINHWSALKRCVTISVTF